MPSSHLLRYLAVCTLSASVAATVHPIPDIPSPDAVAAAARIPTHFDLSACTSNLSTSKFFPAAVNYKTFNGNWSDANATFLQQYQVIDHYWKPGGPILFWQGAEGPIFCLDKFGYFLDLAKDLGAMFVQIEHRYFGISVPHRLNASDPSSWDPEYLKEDLNLDNILQDTLALLRWIKEVGYPDAKHSKIVNLGGSYTGIISALSRVRYPDFFWITYAGGFPNHFVTDPNDPLVDGWLAWTNTVWNDLNPVSAGILKQGFKDLRHHFAQGHHHEIKKGLNLCSSLATDDDLYTFIGAVAQLHMACAQHNIANNDFPLYRLINATLEASTPFEALAETIRIASSLSGEEPACYDWQPHLGLVDPFNYLSCTLVPGSLMESSSDMIWGEHKIDRSLRHILDPLCKPVYGISSITGGIEYSRKMGLDRENLRKLPRTVLTFGTQDPTTAFGMVPWHLTADREAARIFWLSKGAHGSEVYVPDPRDPDSVVDVRNTIRNLFRLWLDMEAEDC